MISIVCRYCDIFAFLLNKKLLSDFLTKLLSLINEYIGKVTNFLISTF